MALSPSSRTPSVSSEKPKTGLAANPYNPSSAAYLAYPVRHVISSLYRRMTEPPDIPVHRLLDAPAVSKPQSYTYTLPQRASPFQPPPLTSLQLDHDPDVTVADELLLTRSLAEEIRLLIPPRLQLVNRWRLAYSLSTHGSSIGTLYAQCDKALGPRGTTQRGGFVLVVRDGSQSASDGSVFGAYLTDPPRPSDRYFGTGECFLWRASILPNLANIAARVQVTEREASSSEELLELAGLPLPPSADTTNAQRTTTVRGERRRSSAANSPTSPRHTSLFPSGSLRPLNLAPSGQSTPDRIRFKAFPYSGVNDFMIYCQHDYLSVGGGDGKYGLWLDEQLEKGITESCPAFGNEPLSDEGRRFDVLGVEIWYIGS